jgi:para-aminobenzoate synthetase/4-amino-4-deoxychorismate lyase
MSQAELDQLFGGMAPPQPLTEIRPRLAAADHAERLEKISGYLKAGDVYQVNFTFPIDVRYHGEPLALYAVLRASQPVAHGGVIGFDAGTILSISPELLLEVGSGQATTRPMKGTVARGASPEADRAALAGLRADPKQRAENLMIVDLLRNDLGRISEIGSVEVPRLFTVETYPTLHTMTSTITSRVRRGLSIRDVVSAVFPCGSITGAPKLRAMEIVRELEDDARGVYCGAMGAIDPNGDLRFNVAIRTLTIFPDHSGCYGAGGGIVADSNAVAEYAEALLKAKVLTELAEDYGLIETLCWSVATGFLRLRLHLDRLERSARDLGFRFDRAGIESRLAAMATTFGQSEARRIRLQLARSGDIDITAPVLPPESDRPLVVVLAPLAADAGDPFLRYKTTRRRLQEAAFASAAERGADEALLLNRAGHVTEASRSNVFVERDGVLLTPPLTDGVLPGVLRQSLIESGEAIEQHLTPADLARAERWFLGNSLRGLRVARFRS